MTVLVWTRMEGDLSDRSVTSKVNHEIEQDNRLTVGHVNKPASNRRSVPARHVGAATALLKSE